MNARSDHAALDAAHCRWTCGSSGLPSPSATHARVADVSPVAVEIALARAGVARQQYAEAARRLEPLVGRALAQPDRHVDLLVLYAVAKANARAAEEAAGVLWPLATRHGAWRIQWERERLLWQSRSS